MSTKTILLGAEYDDRVRTAVTDALEAARAVIVQKWSGIGGSQEDEVLEATIDGRPLRIEAETYVGITVTAGEQVADEFAAEVKRRLS
jgi:hypothetical protein